MANKFVIKSFKITKEKATNSMSFKYVGPAGFLKFSKPEFGQYKTWGATKWPYSETSPSPTILYITADGIQQLDEIVEVYGDTTIGVVWLIKDPFGQWPAHLDWVQVEDISVEYFPSKSDMGVVELEEYTRQSTNNPEGLK